jgi:uncharacterized membrane protein affecting hemolysin expression
MDPHSKQELLTALSSKDVEKYTVLIQDASVIDDDVSLMVIISSNADALRAVLKHSSINPFSNNNQLIHIIINHNMLTEFLAIILEHPLNQLTADHYHSFIALSGCSKEKKELLESYLGKL